MRRIALLAMMLFAVGMVAGCGGKKGTTKRAPVYPACETNAHCAEHGEVCVGSRCVECATAEHCKAKGPCRVCENNVCAAKTGCCTSDKDCKANEMCRIRAGRKEGTCSPK